MSKSFLAKLSIATLLCMAVVSCQFSSSSESSFSFEVQSGDDQEGYVITGEPIQMLEISNDLLEYLKSMHINDEEDAQQFEETIDDVKLLFQAVSDSINARIDQMDPKEKGALISETTAVSDQLEENNPAIEQEIERLVKEAEEQGITLSVDL